MENSIHISASKHTSPFSFFLVTNRKEVKWIALIAIFYVSAPTSMLVAIYYLGRVTDALVANSYIDIRTNLIYMITGVICYELFFRIGNIIETFSFSRIRANSLSQLFKYVTKLHFGYFADRFSGQIAHKISVASRSIDTILSFFLITFVEEGAVILVSAVSLFLVNKLLGLFILAWGILFSLGLAPLYKKVNKRSEDYADVESKTTGVLVDFFTNISSVKVYGQSLSEDAVIEQIENEKKYYRRLGFWSVLSNHYLGLSIITMCVGFIVVSSYLYSLSLITVGNLVFISAVALRLVSIIWEIGWGANNFIKNLGECRQNLRDLIVPITISDGEQTEKKLSKTNLMEIEYKDVVFDYGKDKNVIDGLSLKIKPGEKVGVVGLSGAGKTTLANLLLRFFDVKSGGIYINGVDIKDFSQDFLRSHISYISQDSSLFHTTISDNISYGLSQVPEERIYEAAKLAYADEFIKELSNGYKTIVGERGVKLSGGQRQRIAIARAILANRPIFLLDEATSALDSESEIKIQEALVNLMKGKTVIAIAHRLSTLANMDRIIFLEDGKIVEDGTHEELLKKNGKYANLWEMQIGGFIQ